MQKEQPGLLHRERQLLCLAEASLEKGVGVESGKDVWGQLVYNYGN